MFRRPPRSPLFPYTTLSRSCDDRVIDVGDRIAVLYKQSRHTPQQAAAVRAAPVIAGVREMPTDVSQPGRAQQDRKSTRLNSSHANISYAVFCLKKKNTTRSH